MMLSEDKTKTKWYKSMLKTLKKAYAAVPKERPKLLFNRLVKRKTTRH